MDAKLYADCAHGTQPLEKALLENVSHELKTPLTVISAALDQPEINREEVIQAVRRLHRTVEHLLAAARLDAGQMQPNFEWCDPGELTTDAVAAIASEGHEIRVTLSPDLPFTRVDASFVERALGILLANAITHSPATEPVELTVVRNGDVLIWSVFDRGPGFAPGEETRVFAKYYRGAGRPTGGLGLGLFIAQQLVELLGGTLTANNRQDEGACFALYLPIGGECRLPSV